MKKYGLPHTPRTPQKPVPMDLTGDAGKRVVVATAKRVIKKHAKVIKALADR
jgi:hypothetical protein